MVTVTISAKEYEHLRKCEELVKKAQQLKFPGGNTPEASKKKTAKQLREEKFDKYIN